MPTATQYENLTPYKVPEYYMGATWHGWYAVIGQTRDSDALTRSNYRRVFEDLKALDTELLEGDIDPRQEGDDNPGDSTVTDTRASHWGPGWVETVYVHSSNKAACELADSIVGSLQDYGCYDESDYSALESEEQMEAWESHVSREFSEALSKRLIAAYEANPASNPRDGESEADWTARTEAAIEWLEDGADITPEDLHGLFHEAFDIGCSEWHDGYVNAEDVLHRALDGEQAEWKAPYLKSWKLQLKAAMGDLKYTHGIYKWVDPDQLTLF